MKIDRFWITQILIIATLFAILIGSYLFSFGWFADKPATVSQTTMTQTTEPVAVEKPVVEAIAPVVAPQPATPPPATCSAAGEAPSLASISDSLSSNDPVRQQRCFTFLQAESQAGDKGAELWLGRAYHNGWGVAKNLEEAAAYYGRAVTTDDNAVRESAQQWLLQLQQEQQAIKP